MPMAEKDQSIVEQKLSLSDTVVNEDLLRFYTPKGFVPVDRQKYNYLNPKVKSNTE